MLINCEVSLTLFRQGLALNLINILFFIEIHSLKNKIQTTRVKQKKHMINILIFYQFYFL